MNHTLAPNNILILPRLRIQSANSISSPLTHGFPSITAFLGLLNALERKLSDRHPDRFLDGIGVVCHQHQELTHTDQFGEVSSFCLTRNPVNKSGQTAAIVEEGRVHLEVSLIIGVNLDSELLDDAGDAEFAESAMATVTQMRVAGGTVIPNRDSYQKPAFLRIGTEQESHDTFSESMRHLLPGFALVSRDDLLQQRLLQMKTKSPETTLFDAWLDLSRFNWSAQQEETIDTKTGEKKTTVKWQHDRKSSGWIVPIPVGYGALSDLQAAGSVANARDASTPFRFVESLYSIGEWIGPHRLSQWQELIWYIDNSPDTGLYRARNDYAALAQPAS